MATDIVRCPACSANNRLSPDASSGQLPTCGSCKQPLPWLVDATDESFAREADAPVPVLVDLWAPWCGPCRMVAPVLAELSRELAGRLKVIKVDVDQNPKLATRFDARSIPLLVLLRDGHVRERVVGVQPKAVLRRLVESAA